MANPPWNQALYQLTEQQARRLEEAEAEIVALKVTIVNLKRRLQQARLVHANWKLRQQAWRAERDELLRRLARASGSTTAGS